MPRPIGLPKTGGREKGTKNKETLLKEERRVVFDKRISQKWEKTIDKLKPEYIADQFMGKAVERFEVETKVELDVDISKVIDKIYGKPRN